MSCRLLDFQAGRQPAKSTKCCDRANRNIGATDPKKAAPGTIRALYGKDISENAIHASDSPESSERECKFHFAAREIYDDARQGAF